MAASAAAYKPDLAGGGCYVIPHKSAADQRASAAPPPMPPHQAQDYQQQPAPCPPPTSAADRSHQSHRQPEIQLTSCCSCHSTLRPFKAPRLTQTNHNQISARKKGQAATLTVNGVREVIETAGTSLLYLPPYSPDLNPIELAFSKLNRLLRDAAERTVKELWQTIERLLNRFTPTQCTNDIRHCGFAQSSQ